MNFTSFGIQNLTCTLQCPQKNADAFAPALSYAVLALFDFRNTVVFDDIVHILVTTTGNIDYDDFVLIHGGRKFHSMSHSVCAFDSGDNTLDFGQIVEGIHCLLIGSRHIFGTTGVIKIGVLRPDAWIIEAGGD